MIMETEKSQNLLCASWRSREAGGIKAREPRELMVQPTVCSSWSAGEDECPSSKPDLQRQLIFPYFFLFCSGLQGVG